jgi:sugar lactone lactonase YvrE
MQRLLLSKEFVPTPCRCRAGRIAALMLATVVSAAFAQSRAARTQGAGASSQDGPGSSSTGPGGTGLAKIAVLDTDNHRVEVFDRNGNRIGQFEPGFDLPAGIALDASSNLYVADTGNKRIEKLDTNGVYLSQFGSFGSGNGQFSYPVGLAFDLHGHVSVTDVGNDRIQKFDPNGNYLSQFGSNQLFFAPYGVVVRN